MAGEQGIFVANGKRDFFFKRNIPQIEFEYGCILINSFQETMSYLAMDFHSRPNDGIRLRVTLICDFHKSNL